MSSVIILIPVTRKLLDWAQECEVPVSLDIPNGRAPTDTDIRAVLEFLDGYTVTFGGSEEDSHIQVDSIEMVDWYDEGPDPVGHPDLGRLRRIPKQWVTIRPAHSEKRSVSFDGHSPLFFRIAQELARRCGPLAIVDSNDGIPVFLLPEAESPIWKDPWF